MNEKQAIIIALCRCALVNRNNAIEHQIKRLQQYYILNGKEEMANRIKELFSIDNNVEFKIVKS